MKLLILTQKVDKDDSYFAFFHDWIIRFARECQSVTVISLEVGNHNLPPNVRIVSLGKESNSNRFLYLTRLFYYLTKFRNNYDAIFAHMSPWYAILSYPWALVLKKKLGLWYVHRAVDFKLRVAHVVSDIIFTATPESFNIESKKVEYMGQSVPLENFARSAYAVPSKPHMFKIVTVGRITPIKNLDILFHAVAQLPNEINYELHVIGAPVARGDGDYLETLKVLAQKIGIADKIVWRGAIKNADLNKELHQAHVSVNLCPPGGLDKAVLESMAARVPVIVANTAFKEYFNGHTEHIVSLNDIQKIAQELVWIWNGGDPVEKYTNSLYDSVSKLSNLDHMIHKIIDHL